MFTFHSSRLKEWEELFTLKGPHYSVNVYLRACRFRLLNSKGTEEMSFRRLFRFLCLKEESYVNNEMNIRLNLTKWYNTETEMLGRAAFSISVSKKRRIQRRLVVLLFKCSPRTHTCIPWCNNQVPPLPPLPLYLHQHFLPLSNFKHYISLSFFFLLQNWYLTRTVYFSRKTKFID